MRTTVEDRELATWSFFETTKLWALVRDETGITDKSWVKEGLRREDRCKLQGRAVGLYARLFSDRKALDEELSAGALKMYYDLLNRWIEEGNGPADWSCEESVAEREKRLDEELGSDRERAEVRIVATGEFGEIVIDTHAGVLRSILELVAEWRD